MNNIFNLKGKSIAITGAAGLLGREFAFCLAENGADLILIDKNIESLRLLCDEIRINFSAQVFELGIDITDETQVKQSVSMVRNTLGKVTGLINNAARNPKMEAGVITTSNRLEDFDLKQWNDDLSVGLGGSFLCAKHFGMAMAKQESGGVIINVSSDLGLISPDQRLYSLEGRQFEEQPVKPVSYSVVKTGILGLTRYLATYWPGIVRCNAICPGGVEVDQSPEFVAKISELIPLGRMARVSEYAPTMVYLMSDASSYLNGAVIPIDGGRSIW